MTKPLQKYNIKRNYKYNEFKFESVKGKMVNIPDYPFVVAFVGYYKMGPDIKPGWIVTDFRTGDALQYKPCKTIAEAIEIAIHYMNEYNIRTQSKVKNLYSKATIRVAQKTAYANYFEYFQRP